MTEVVQQKAKVLFAQEESVLAGVSLEQLDLPTPPDMSYLYTNTLDFFHTSKTLFTRV